MRINIYNHENGGHWWPWLKLFSGVGKTLTGVGSRVHEEKESNLWT